MLVLSLIFRLVFFEKCSFFSSATRQQQQNIHKSKMTHPYRTPCMKMTQFRRRRQKIWSIKEDQNFFCFVQIIQYDIIKSERCNFKKSCHFSLLLRTLFKNSNTFMLDEITHVVFIYCFLVFNLMNVLVYDKINQNFLGRKFFSKWTHCTHFCILKIWQIFLQHFQ